MLFSNISEEEFEFIHESELKGTIYKEVRIKNRGCRCECGTFHTNVKEYRKRKSYTQSMHIKNVCSSTIIAGSSVLIVKPLTWT